MIDGGVFGGVKGGNAVRLLMDVMDAMDVVVGRSGLDAGWEGLIGDCYYNF